MEPALRSEGISLCRHCETAFPGESAFCCRGCETVHGILQARGLSHYYELRKNSPRTSISRPVSSERRDFRFLRDVQETTLRFWLEGVHCLSCLWLLEKLPEIVPGVEASRLNLGSSVLDVKVLPGTSFEAVAEALQELGYPPHPIARDASEHQRRENRTLLVRLGVAGACAGNIMLLAIAQYSGASGAWASAFGWIAAALSIPVLAYSAVPFYVSTRNSLRRKRISIDLPIVAAVWAAAAASFWNLLSGREEVYFDSLSTLVFLLLASRYLLRRIQQTQLSSSHLLEFLASDRVKIVRSGGIAEIPLPEVKPGDRLLVAAGSRFPADGILRRGETHADLSLLTGESVPVPVRMGDVVYAGTVNLDVDTEVEATAVGQESRLGSIVRQIALESGFRAPVVEFADRVARWFVTGVLCVALAVVLFHLASDPAEGVRRALALVIVTCPCVLAFALPLGMALTMRKLAAKGILVKDARILEQVSETRHFFLDKTGTLTNGVFQVVSWETLSGEEREIRSAVLALELKSRHPVARALVRHLSRNSAAAIPDVENFLEILRQGVEGTIDGSLWKVGRIPGPDQKVGVWKNGEAVARIFLGDTLREESRAAIDEIRSRGSEIHLLSGDRDAAVQIVAKELGIVHALGDLTPEAKAEIVRSHPRSAMVGDGANDAAAFSAAGVGIAMHGSVEMALQTAHVFLSRPGLTGLLDLLRAAGRNARVIRVNLLFSASYNVLGGVLAVIGWMTPLWAAVLMPLSALTVFASTMAQLRRGT